MDSVFIECFFLHFFCAYVLNIGFFFSLRSFILYTMLLLSKNMFLMFVLFFFSLFSLVFMFRLITCRWTFYLHILVFIINIWNGYSDTIDYSHRWLSPSHMIKYECNSLNINVCECVCVPHTYINFLLIASNKKKTFFSGHIRRPLIKDKIWNHSKHKQFLYQKKIKW